MAYEVRKSKFLRLDPLRESYVRSGFLDVLFGLLIFMLACYLKRRERIDRELTGTPELSRCAAIVRKLSNLATQDRASTRTERPRAPTVSRVSLGAGVLALISLVAFFDWIMLTARVPLTYDEGWNWSSVASQGMRYAYLTYEAPNNHTLFSMMQSRLPETLVTPHPSALRLINLIVLAALVVLLICELKSGWLVSGILLASPILTLYVFLARGYLLGAALALAGALLLLKGNFSFAGVCVGLAACDVPTFELVAPGLALFSAISNGARRGASIFAALALAIPVIFYLPKLRIMLEMRHLYNRTSTLHELLLGTARLSANTTWLSVALFLALCLGFVRARPGPARKTASCLLGACFSYLGCIVLLVVLQISNSPFLRNGMFLPLFVWVAVALLASTCPGRLRMALLGLLLVNALFGVLLITNCFVSSKDNPLDYPGLAELAPVPGRQIESLPVTSMTAAWAAIPAAQLYANKLHLRLKGVLSLTGDCLVGRYPPPKESMGIVVDTKDGRRGLACF